MTLDYIIDYMGLKHDNWDERMKLDAILFRLQQQQDLMNKYKKERDAFINMAKYYSAKLAKAGHDTRVDPKELEEILNERS
jgi:hypothetical protein